MLMAAAAESTDLRHLRETTDASHAVIKVRTDVRSAHAVPRTITGKFAEHLGWNIYNGMWAEVLKNPTFAAYSFSTGQSSPDGVATYHWQRDRIHAELRQQGARFGWPDADEHLLVEGWDDGLAAFWGRIGSREAVRVSPDTGPHGGRAQRIEITAGGQGIGQWTWLPDHRTRDFEFEIGVRSPDLRSLDLTLETGGAKSPVAHAEVDGIDDEWKTFHGSLRLRPDVPAGGAYRLSLTGGKPGQWVVQRVLLRPSDHVDGSDPDVIRLLRDSHLPILRWPGGNFVSGYHWEDGIGPTEARPTRPNPAWGGVEPNLFGTDEFMAFCRAAGCEPMICVNAGDGTPTEAARWVEYCNGSTHSPMGALRAANGHPEPYRVRHWEVGNELWGRWQVHWTTRDGNVDRFHEFASAMRAADPEITLYACGAPVFWGEEWNRALIAGGGPMFHWITDHPLIGGDVAQTADPLDVFRDFMAVPEELQRRWTLLWDEMTSGGVQDSRLAITELQVFAHVGARGDASLPARLNGSNLPNQGSITEALYDVLIYHACLRLAPFIDLVTHSAVVNHGGGLRKQRERVYANPCYFAQSAFSAFAGATPVAVEIEAAPWEAPRVLPDLRRATPRVSCLEIDAFAALDASGAVLLSVVQRGTSGPVHTSIEVPGFAAAEEAEVRLLSGDSPSASNTLEAPEAVHPVDLTLPVRQGQLSLDLPPYSVARVRIPRAGG